MYKYYQLKVHVLHLDSKVPRHFSLRAVKHTLQTWGIWKRLPCVLAWAENIFKTELLLFSSFFGEFNSCRWPIVITMLNVAFIPGKPRNKMDLKEVNIFFCTCRVSSVHNRRVTQFIVNELGRRSGFSQATVESKHKLKKCT